ncbi:MAG: hypothetical protein WCE73_21815, partial [Candidatus Angelobacter sp.]
TAFYTVIGHRQRERQSLKTLPRMNMNQTDQELPNIGEKWKNKVLKRGRHRSGDSVSGETDIARTA